MNLPKAVCFDLDGVLVDMPQGHYEALNKALKLFGFSIEPNDHLNKYNGLPTKQKLKMMSENEGMPWGLHKVICEQKKIYTKEQVKLRCIPEYSKILLLSYLKNKGVKLACCSNAIQSSVKDMLKGAGLDKFFDEIIGNDEGFKPKPSPDIYLEAFKRLGVEPKDTWIVEDAPYGIEAAKASGAARVLEVSGYEQVNLNLFLN
jgi:HAD superfamily hydrolase (TIGR01509 family)